LLELSTPAYYFKGNAKTFSITTFIIITSSKLTA